MNRGDAGSASNLTSTNPANAGDTTHPFHTPLRESDWDAALRRNDASLLQSWRWGDFKANSGWSVWRVAMGSIPEATLHVQASPNPLICAQVLLRGLPGIPRLPIPVPLSIGYIPRGPVYSPQAQENDKATPAFWRRVHRWARWRGAIFLKVEPDIKLSENITKADVDREMAALGFRPSGRLQPARTIVLDIDKSEEDLLKDMKPKTRYNLRLAGRRGVEVRRAATLGDLQAFYSLLEVTGERDDFGIHTFPYYEKLWQTFGATSNVSDILVLLAEHPDPVERESGPIGGLLALRFGDEAIYMYGASSDKGREHMPNYLLQWEAIKWAREQGCTLYDFWGIPDAPEEGSESEISPVNTRSGLRGVYWFKKGFGGREVEYPGAYDYVYNPLLYKLWMRWRGPNLG
ncbi:MAG: peptidoglycan bridge formation glycyltransferase FemA/FemB family protein [Chloroflexi bacterium]|nr:peptidoglycan bridge formation glycyltransferase FemA/FemB family protein [Chloroflexota bacterium]